MARNCQQHKHCKNKNIGTGNAKSIRTCLCPPLPTCISSCTSSSWLCEFSESSWTKFSRWHFSRNEYQDRAQFIARQLSRLITHSVGGFLADLSKTSRQHRSTFKSDRERKWDIHLHLCLHRCVCALSFISVVVLYPAEISNMAPMILPAPVHRVRFAVLVLCVGGSTRDFFCTGRPAPRCHLLFNVSQGHRAPYGSHLGFSLARHQLQLKMKLATTRNGNTDSSKRTTDSLFFSVSYFSFHPHLVLQAVPLSQILAPLLLVRGGGPCASSKEAWLIAGDAGFERSGCRGRVVLGTKVCLATKNLPDRTLWSWLLFGLFGFGPVTRLHQEL